jgi:hypothetical protein
MSKRTDLRIWDGLCLLLKSSQTKLDCARQQWLNRTSGERAGTDYDSAWCTRGWILLAMDRFIERRS